VALLSLHCTHSNLQYGSSQVSGVACEEDSLIHVVLCWQTIAERERIEAEEEARYDKEKERLKERKVGLQQCCAAATGNTSAAGGLRSWTPLVPLLTICDPLALDTPTCMLCVRPCCNFLQAQPGRKQWFDDAHSASLQKETRELVIQRLEQEKAEDQAGKAGPVGVDDVDTDDEVLMNMITITTILRWLESILLECSLLHFRILAMPPCVTACVRHGGDAASTHTVRYRRLSVGTV